MEELSVTNKIKRFKHCNPDFYSLIKKVLIRIPEAICFEGILDDLSFEIVSYNNNSVGRYYQFEREIESIVVLNEKILNFPESAVIYIIVYGIAHKIKKKGEEEIYGEEMEELLAKWGFKNEVDRAKYERPILESEGYQIGNGWARKQKDLSKYEEFYNEWNEVQLSGERLEEFLYVADTFSVLYETRFFEGESVNFADEDDFLIIPKDATFDNAFLSKGIVWGVMGFLKEKRRKADKKIL